MLNCTKLMSLSDLALFSPIRLKEIKKAGIVAYFNSEMWMPSSDIIFLNLFL